MIACFVYNLLHITCILSCSSNSCILLFFFSMFYGFFVEIMGFRQEGGKEKIEILNNTILINIIKNTEVQKTKH